MRGITLGNSKQGISSDLRDCVVPDKLGNFDPFGPIILSIIDIGPKVLPRFDFFTFPELPQEYQAMAKMVK